MSKTISQTAAKKIAKEQGLPKTTAITHACGCVHEYQSWVFLRMGITHEEQAATKCCRHR